MQGSERNQRKKGVNAMKKALAIMLLAALSLSGQSKDEATKARELEKDGIRLVLFGDESQTSAAIEIDPAWLREKADFAIVRIVYETNLSYSLDADSPEISVVLTKESVVPAYEGVLVMADPAPVSLEKVRSVRVTLVRKISETEFKVQEE